MFSSLRHRIYFRKILTVVGLIVCLFILAKLAPRLVTPQQMASDDFIEYWTAGRVNLFGGNPYDPEQLLPLQVEAGRTENVPLMMWNPPWTLILVMPFGLLDYISSRMLWFLFLLLIFFFCINWYWRYFNGEPSKQWVVWIVGFASAAAIQLFKLGQITPFLMMGILGFLHFEKRQKWWLAGAMISLTLIKPQLLYLCILSVVIWAIYKKRWPVLGGMTVSLMVAIGLSMAPSPNLISYYIHAVMNYPPQEYITATLGAALRLFFGFEKTWLQFVPSILGSTWFISYWWPRRDNWQWQEQMPLICIVSIATTAYGWIFDQTLMLPAFIHIAVMVLNQGMPITRILIGSTYFIINLLPLLPFFINQHQFWWLGIWNLLWYLSARKILSKPAHLTPIIGKRIRSGKAIV